jgi:hypothetical protein
MAIYMELSFVFFRVYRFWMPVVTAFDSDWRGVQASERKVAREGGGCGCRPLAVLVVNEPSRKLLFSSVSFPSLSGPTDP